MPIPSTNCSLCQTDNPLLLSNPSAAHRSRATTASGNTDPLLSAPIPSTNCSSCQTDTSPSLLHIARSLSTFPLTLANPRSLLTLLPKLLRLAATSLSSLVCRLFRLTLLYALQNELHPVCASFVQPIHLHIHTFFVLTPLATLWAILLDVCPFAMMDYVHILLEWLII